MLTLLPWFWGDEDNSMLPFFLMLTALNPAVAPASGLSLTTYYPWKKQILMASLIGLKCGHISLESDTLFA